MSNFDKETYIGLFAKEGPAKALKYLSDVQPQQLYKFYSLNNDEGLNEKKLSTLKKGKIWVDVFKNQNDPFEMVGLDIDKTTVYAEYKDNGEVLLSKELLVDAYQKYMDEIKKNVKIASFCQNMETNIAMWAYYTNNHSGFCCEYEPLEKNINGSRVLRPIIYENSITKTKASFIQHYIGEQKDLLGTKKEDKKDKLLLLDEMLRIICSCKSLSWEHEHEYRGIYWGDKNIEGEEVDCSKLNVKLKAIYSGINCSNDNKEKLKEIAKELDVDFYEMSISSDNFSLIRIPTHQQKRTD